jgi:hypothetical protein
VTDREDPPNFATVPSLDVVARNAQLDPVLLPTDGDPAEVKKVLSTELDVVALMPAAPILAVNAKDVDE